MSERYKVVRYRFKGDNRTVKRGLTLEEAQAHCRDPETRGPGWFDGYTEDDDFDPTEAELLGGGYHSIPKEYAED